MRVFLSFLAVAALASPQTESDTLLARALPLLQATARRLERYVCIETVNRNYYQSSVASPACAPADAARRLQSTDRVRLEVTISPSRELHSWPGATGFDTRDVDELIRDGPVSTGSFGGYLSGIFDHPGVAFYYHRELTVEGRAALEYGYSVPQTASLLEVKTGEVRTIMPYEGEFWLDRQSLELRRLTIRIKDPPHEAAFCKADTTLDYQRVHIGDSDVLLPRQSELEIVQSGGRQTRNDLSFNSCREYQAESELVFNEPAEAGTAAVPRQGRGRLVTPIGLSVTLALENPIDTDTAATGDPVSAKVVKAVRNPGSKDDVIPAGAVVRGRLRRVEHHLFPKPYFLIAMAFNRVEVQGVLSPFAAHSEADPALVKELGVNLDIRASGIWFWDVGTFLFPTDKTHYVLRAGFESKWFTLATGR